MAYIEALENALGKKGEKNCLPIQPGDVPAGACPRVILSGAGVQCLENPVFTSMTKNELIRASLEMAFCPFDTDDIWLLIFP